MKSTTTNINESNKVSFEITDYKGIKNYIHNYLGLTKDDVRTIVYDVLKELITKEVAKKLNDKEELTRIIEQSIVREIKRDYNKERASWPICTMDEIYHKIDKEIHKQVVDNLIIEFKGVNNEE